MGWFTGCVVYVLVWWTTLFAVLPLWTQPVADADEASGWRGAPSRPLIWRKLLVTTLVTGVIWLGIYALVSSDWLSFRSGWLAMPD